MKTDLKIVSYSQNVFKAVGASVQAGIRWSEKIEVLLFDCATFELKGNFAITQFENCWLVLFLTVTLIKRKAKNELLKS
jgi:hypothetical protein